VRVAAAELRGLALEAHALLVGVPLRDVTAVDLPGGGPGRTLGDVRALVAGRGTRPGLLGGGGGGGRVASALFALRMWLGRVLGWDGPAHDRPQDSYLPRVGQALRARSLAAPGTMEGGFRLLYALPREALAEVRNATVHAFVCLALCERPGGYRLYAGIYVAPTSWLTPLYMAAIEPFRRFIVYPAVEARVRRAWTARYG
jgi:hypothetical protein